MTGLEIGLGTVVILVAVAFLAGWVDAVVGGGGLIQLPALLIGLPDDAPPAAVLSTNKVSSVWGTLTSAITYAVRIRPDWRTIVPLVACAFVGSATGAWLARFLPKEFFTPIVLVAVLAVGFYTWRRPELGRVTALRHSGGRHYLTTAGIGLCVGTYDGILGPGTGTFFVILLVGLLGYGFLEASAKAKIANLTTNIAAITVFGAGGSLLWKLGLLMGGANLLGGLIGARTAINRGNAFIRKVFLIVVAALAVKLGRDTVVQFWP